ncbi:MAG: hypothetical protein QOK20_2840 [Acidimicrobiaceae bacterium]|nr:hypothetical protein [Acidimicrobiaceae bacterium]MDQ1400908.1 hypothetical protein [Acidimicrobiaceae bacterium]
MGQVVGDSPDPKRAAVTGTHTADGTGVSGSSGGGAGVTGESQTNNGVVATSNSGRGLSGTSQSNTAVFGVSTTGRGVEGYAESGYGVYGQSKSSSGVRGTSVSARGVEGWSTSNSGLFGISDTGWGVEGSSKDGRGVSGGSGSNTGVFGESKTGRGVEGYANAGFGVYGESQTWPGVRGTSVSNNGAEGWSTSAAGLFGTSDKGDGVRGETHSPTAAAIRGVNPGGIAGWFQGDLYVTGVFHMVDGADFAEDFSVVGDAPVEPGMVVVLDDSGGVRICDRPYDTRVAGVLSGAGDFRPAVILDRRAGRDALRMPLALTGKVYCLADATDSPIGVGDLLTTSPTPGHAMRATDRTRAFGSTLGKAMGALAGGRGLVPVLVGLG